VSGFTGFASLIGNAVGENEQFMSNKCIFSQFVDMRDNLARAGNKKTGDPEPEPKVRPKSDTVGRIPSRPPTHSLSSTAHRK
jgi:hypothetical protein